MECTQIDLYEFLTESELQQYYNAIKNELKITNAAQFKYATDEDLRHIGLSRPEIRRLRKYCERHFPHGYLSKIKRLLQAPTTIVRREDGAGGSAQNVSETSAAAMDTASPSKVPNNKHIIPADAISVNKQLGTGEFGIVQQGVWTNGTERIQVAIKCLCRERMQSNPMEFLKEAAIMHSIEHENIVRLYGVVLATDSLMLVTELAHLRSLLECLKDSGLRVSFLTIPTLCEFAVQICNGMNYLEQKRLIHRDLAARNILVFSKNKVKISDFGLSRALGVGKDYYKTNFNVNLKLPIAWCAPECINYLRFTNASDVWAYGVCLWEMFSYGFQPWAALTGLQILEAIDAPNYQRLEQPDCCPSEYYTLMMKCWQDDPTKRPKFSEIYEQLPEMKPEQLKTVVNCLEAKKEHLVYRQGEIITVLDRNTGSPFWKGVLSTGKTGFFNPSNTVAFLEGLPSSNPRDSFSRVSDHRSSKRKLRTEMISKPQNDFKHTGHVGIDGASFGDIAFLGSSQNYNHVPRQIVTPYKPSEDIEQTPLLLPPTPTSPDSLQTASGYFHESSNTTTSMNPTFISSNENTPKQLSNQTTFNYPDQRTVVGYNASTNPFAHKSDEEQFAFAALQNNNYGLDRKGDLAWHPATGRNASEDPHEYHEISDDEITADKLDLGPSLLDEINSMFGSISVGSVGQPKSPGFEQINMKNELAEMTSKFSSKIGGDTNNQKQHGHSTSSSSSSSKKKTAGTVKPISVKDEKILNHAIEIANEISARSMIDLVSDHPPATQSPKRKFSFRFPHLSNSVDKSNGNCSTPITGDGGPHTAQHGSPYSKKKNFTEELRSIPDIQRFHSLSEIKNSSEIRIPLFDKESSDFCFEKSREILSRPLALECGSGGVGGVGVGHEPSINMDKMDMLDDSEALLNPKNFNDDIMDIEQTLKALNLDFMHTYTELDKSDSNETILNDQFTHMANSIDDGISSATGSLKSAVYNYSNGVQTMFDFNAATSHLDKHLQYMHNQAQLNASHNDSALQQEQKMIEDKRSSTPDTGFASRDTNLSSRRSSQKSSYSPQENTFAMKGGESSYAISPAYMGLRDEMSGFERFSSKHAVSCGSPNKSNMNSMYSPHHLKLEGGAVRSYRQRSTSFTENFNAVSPVLSEPLQLQKHFALQKDQQQQQQQHIQRHAVESKLPRRSASYKPRSVRARTLRRLSYNPMTIDSSSSSGEEVSRRNQNLARSECDIRSRVSSLYRRRRPGLNRQVLSACHDEREAIVSPRNIYGSNSSIKSAPHFNYPGNRRSFNSRINYEQFNYDEKIYDFGGRGPGNNYGASNNAVMQQPNIRTTSTQQAITTTSYAFNGNETLIGGGVCSVSGSSSAASTAVQAYGSVVRTAANIFQDFDVNRLTGKSPTINYANSSPDEVNPRRSTTSLLTTLTGSNKSQRPSEFHWPERIHGSAVKQNDIRWRQQQSTHSVGDHLQPPGVIIPAGYSSDSSSSTSSDSGDEIPFRSRTEFTPHIPPSPAP